MRQASPSRLFSVHCLAPVGWITVPDLPEPSSWSNCKLAEPVASRRKLSCSESGSALVTTKASLRRNSPPSRACGVLFKRVICGAVVCRSTARVSKWELTAGMPALSLA